MTWPKDVNSIFKKVPWWAGLRVFGKVIFKFLYWCPSHFRHCFVPITSFVLLHLKHMMSVCVSHPVQWLDTAILHLFWLKQQLFPWQMMRSIKKHEFVHLFQNILAFRMSPFFFKDSMHLSWHGLVIPAHVIPAQFHSAPQSFLWCHKAFLVLRSPGKAAFTHVQNQHSPLIHFHSMWVNGFGTEANPQLGFAWSSTLGNFDWQNCSHNQ